MAPGPGPRAGLAGVSRQILRRTTDLIAVALVLAASLTFGRQVLRWWGADARDAAAELAAPPSSLPGDGAPMTLEFGSQPFSFTRQTFAGSHEVALAAMRAVCRAGTDAAATPTGTPDAAESTLLAETQGLAPVDEKPGVWQLFEARGQFDMAVGVGWAGPPGEHGQTSGTGRAGAVRRIACWSLVLPMSETGWLLYTFQRISTSGVKSPDSPTLPLPPLSRKILALRGPDGGVLVGIQGTEPVQDAIGFYDAWFADRRWARLSPWNAAAGGAMSKYLSPPGTLRWTADVQFGSDARGGWTGLLSLAAAEANSQKRGTE